MPTSDLQEKDAYLQRVDLLNIKQDLVLDRARRALRFLKKLDKADIAEVNKPLFNFLNYKFFNSSSIISVCEFGDIKIMFYET